MQIVVKVIFLYFCSRFGALAQLARALDWQSKGHGFDSRTLHKVFTEVSMASVYDVCGFQLKNAFFL